MLLPSEKQQKQLWRKDETIKDRKLPHAQREELVQGQYKAGRGQAWWCTDELGGVPWTKAR